MITGMPIGRRCPLALGTYTRLTGRARQGSDWWCIKFTSSVFSSEVETVLLSIPAVSRPALTSVTRLTLTSVLAKLRSISFCKLRTRLRSPSCVAVKIRCRSRRTWSSACRHLTASHPKPRPEGPFTTPTPAGTADAATSVNVVMASNFPFGSGDFSSARFTGSPAHVSALPCRASARIRPVIRHDRWEEQSYVSLFPSRFRRRRSLLEHPIPAGELTLPHGWVTGALRTPSGLPRCARSRHGWGGCPLYSGTGGVHAADRVWGANTRPSQ